MLYERTECHSSAWTSNSAQILLHSRNLQSMSSTRSKPDLSLSSSCFCISEFSAIGFDQRSSEQWNEVAPLRTCLVTSEENCNMSGLLPNPVLNCTAISLFSAIATRAAHTSGLE